MALSNRYQLASYPYDGAAAKFARTAGFSKLQGAGTVQGKPFYARFLGLRAAAQCPDDSHPQSYRRYPPTADTPAARILELGLDPEKNK